MQAVTLFKKAKTGKISQWKIWVESNTDGAIIYTEHGFIDGQKQLDRVIVNSGKNIGKANETTALEQATSEAQSKISKQRDKGYRDNIEEKETVIRPMLAYKFEDRKKNIKYPAMVQFKLDGGRLLIYNDNSELKLISRNGKEYPHLDHIRNQAKKVLADNPGVVLDGELYTHDLTFQRIIGLVKKQTLTEDDRQDMLKIRYQTYDLILLDQPDAPFVDRYRILNSMLAKAKVNDIVLVGNYDVYDEDQIKNLHNQFVQNGYEGAMVRNASGKYLLNHRSNDLLKYKNFMDDEFEIVKIIDGVGRAEESAIFVCKTKEGKQFNARPEGTEEYRHRIFIERESLIGKMVTVRFFSWTEDMIPRFPVAKVIRDYE